MKKFTLYIKYVSLTSATLDPDQYLLLVDENPKDDEPESFPSDRDITGWGLANWWMNER